MYWSADAAVELPEEFIVTLPFMPTAREVADRDAGEEPSNTVNVRAPYPVTSELTLNSLNVQDAGRRMATGAVFALAMV